MTTSTRRGRILLTWASLLEQCGTSCTVGGQRLREINVHRGAAGIAALNLAAPAGLVMADVFATKKG